MLLEFDPKATGKDRLQPARFFFGRAEVVAFERAFDPAEGAAGQRRQPLVTPLEILDPQTSVALASAHLRR